MIVIWRPADPFVAARVALEPVMEAFFQIQLQPLKHPADPGDRLRLLRNGAGRLWGARQQPYGCCSNSRQCTPPPMSTNLDEAASQQPNVRTPKALWNIAQGCRASGYPGAVKRENRPT